MIEHYINLIVSDIYTPIIEGIIEHPWIAFFWIGFLLLFWLGFVGVD